MSEPVGHQFAAAGGAELPVDGFDVMVDGVGAESHLPTNLLFTLSAEQGVEGLVLARRELEHIRAGEDGVWRIERANCGIGQFDQQPLAGREGDFLFFVAPEEQTGDEDAAERKERAEQAMVELPRAGDSRST